ncbi:hypothetical protein, partial [Neisseria gonorrhoeae]|uniref:hypothetical protein n=1 Tax=Neisseria gonorrhoeae TaxID=485 RepID=UPI0030EEAAAB
RKEARVNVMTDKAKFIRVSLMADCPGRIGIGSGGVFSGFGSKQGRHSALIWCFIYWGKTDSQKYHWNMVMLPYILAKKKKIAGRRV